MATTLADIRTAVSDILGLANDSSLDQPHIDRRANEAVREILRETKAYVISQTVTPGANQDYSLDTLNTDAIEILNLSMSSNSITWTLEPVTRDEILRMRQVSSSTPSPAHYYALAGHDTLMFYPTPGASDTMTIYYVPLPTEMSSGTHDPFSLSGTNYGRLPIAAYPTLIDYCCWRLADYDDDASSQQGERYRAYYEQGIAKLRKHLRNRGGYRLPPARVKRRLLYIPHSNS